MSHLDMKYYVEQEPCMLKQVIQSFDKNKEVFHSFKKNYESIIIFATGSSANAAFSAKPYMSKILNIDIEIKEPSMAFHYESIIRKNTLYIAISQGGHSFSTLNIIKKIQKTDEVYVITSDPDSPIGKEANHLLLLDLIEDMPFVTVGQTATIIYLMKLSLLLAMKQNKITEIQWHQKSKQINEVIDLIPECINKINQWFEKEKTTLYKGTRFICIGYGSTYGVSKEFETKFTETVRVPSSGFELEEFMHGPYIGMNSNDIIFTFDSNGLLSTRMNKLVYFLKKHVNQVYYFTNQQHELSADICFDLKVDENLTCILYNLIVHLVSWYISQYKKIDLTKSTYPDFDESLKSKI